MKDEKKIKAALNLWGKLSKTFETVRKAHVKAMQEYDLTGPQFGVMEVLYISGPMPLKKISERLFVSGANITCVVDNLEKEALVKRVPSSTDRRIIQAELTDKGKEKMANIFPLYSQNIFSIIGKLSETEQNDLFALLNKLDPD